ncbi:DUF1906 domain-containing protein [Mycobacterium sp.]|uniref:DUF1906 domain-containing protein n=1 Tax=Mycobacterium sp. TaxID=1785 RepID=UPI003A8BCA2F
MHDSQATSPRRGAPNALTRREALKYALTPALVGLAASAVAGAPTASAGNGQLLDFAQQQIPPEVIKAAGYLGVVNYVSESRPGANFGAKPITRGYAGALRAAGLHIVSNYQYGKPGGTAPSDFTRGYQGGVADARTAIALHNAAGGGRSAPIFFSVDDDINHDIWAGPAIAWFRGINSVLGVGRTGIYGHSRACRWAIDDGVIGQSSSAGHSWAWQTRSWSYGEREPAAVLYQVVVNAPPLDGVSVDINDILAADYGQWDLHR